MSGKQIRGSGLPLAGSSEIAHGLNALRIPNEDCACQMKTSLAAAGSHQERKPRGQWQRQPEVRLHRALSDPSLHPHVNRLTRASWHVRKCPTLGRLVVIRGVIVALQESSHQTRPYACELPSFRNSVDTASLNSSSQTKRCFNRLADHSIQVPWAPWSITCQIETS